jgi:hypothetical protein
MNYRIENEDILDEDIEDIMSDNTMSNSEKIIASRKRKLENMDSDYKDAIIYLSYRVECPRCRAKKGQVCRGTTAGKYVTPAHKVRLNLLKFKNQKVYDNLKYAMNSRYWKECDWNKIVKESKEYRETGKQQSDDDEFVAMLEVDEDYETTETN